MLGFPWLVQASVLTEVGGAPWPRVSVGLLMMAGFCVGSCYVSKYGFFMLSCKFCKPVFLAFCMPDVCKSGFWFRIGFLWGSAF